MRKKKSLPLTKKAIRLVLVHLNLPATICNHCIGKEHKLRHRRTAGAIVMVVGVMIAHTTAEWHIFVLQLAGDIVGYALHGTGLIPFLEKEEEEKKEE